MRRFTRGHWKKFLTITMPPGHGWPKRPNLRYQAAALRRLWRGLHQHFGDFEAAWIREIGAVTNCICKKRGWHDPAPYSELNPVARGAFHELLDCQCGAGGERLHLHAVVSIERWIDPQLLSRLATRAGFGFVDVRAVRSAGVRDYLTEYLAKAPPPGAESTSPRGRGATTSTSPSPKPCACPGAGRTHPTTPTACSTSSAAHARKPSSGGTTPTSKRCSPTTPPDPLTKIPPPRSARGESPGCEPRSGFLHRRATHPFTSSPTTTPLHHRTRHA